MNIIVHLLIAQSIRKTVYEQIGIKLSYTGFLYGNILPDISAEYDKLPHFFSSFPWLCGWPCITSEQ